MPKNKDTNKLFVENTTRRKRRKQLTTRKRPKQTARKPNTSVITDKRNNRLSRHKHNKTNFQVNEDQTLIEQNKLWGKQRPNINKTNQTLRQTTTKSKQYHRQTMAKPQTNETKELPTKQKPNTNKYHIQPKQTHTQTNAQTHKRKDDITPAKIYPRYHSHTSNLTADLQWPNDMAWDYHHKKWFISWSTNRES